MTVDDAARIEPPVSDDRSHDSTPTSPMNATDTAALRLGRGVLYGTLISIAMWLVIAWLLLRR